MVPGEKIITLNSTVSPLGGWSNQSFWKVPFHSGFFTDALCTHPNVLPIEVYVLNIGAGIHQNGIAIDSCINPLLNSGLILRDVDNGGGCYRCEEDTER